MVLCIDCGLTKGKLLLFSETGACLGAASFDTPLSHALIDSQQLRSLLYGALRDLTRHADSNPQSISCITVSGHGNGLYLVGADDVLPIGYSSMMTESAQFLPPAGQTFPMILQSDWAGQPLPILSWLKHTKPDIYSQAKTVLFCKDLLRWFLTGIAVTEETDASAAGLLNAHTGQYDMDLLRMYDLQDVRAKLPPVFKSSACAGTVTQAVSEKTGLPAGIPVLGGLFDVNSCMLGSGVIDTGTYSLIAGTWGINAAPSRAPAQSGSITQCCRFYGAAPYVCIDSAPTSCSNLEWFRQTVLGAIPYEAVNALVANEPADESLIYMPYLYAPMDLPKAQGGFIGLKPQHNTAAMLRAVFEGIVFEHRYRLERLRQAGILADKAILSGGASKSDVFLQMFADVCEIPFSSPSQNEAGALGGAILGLTASGVYPNASVACQKLVRYPSTVFPNKKMAEYYHHKYQKFCEIQRKWA